MRTPTSQQCFKILFPHLNLDWKLIYLLPRILTKNTSLRAFQYKVLNSVLYLNLKLFQFKVSAISICSYCNKHDETVQHLFSACNEVISLWTEIKLYFVNDIKLIALCPQTAILGYTNTGDRWNTSTKFISLKLCVGLSILDFVSFLLKFVFLFNKKHGLFNFKTSWLL